MFCWRHRLDCELRMFESLLLPTNLDTDPHVDIISGGRLSSGSTPWIPVPVELVWIEVSLYSIDFLTEQPLPRVQIE